MGDRFYTMNRPGICQRGFSLDPAWGSNNEAPSIKISLDEKKVFRSNTRTGNVFRSNTCTENRRVYDEHVTLKLKTRNKLIRHKSDPFHDPISYIDGFTVPSAPGSKESMWLKRAFDFVYDGQYEDAISAYNSAITINPSNREVWYDLAISYVRVGKYILALKCFDKALELNFPNPFTDLDADIWLNKGLIYFTIGTYGSAVECLMNSVSFGGGSSVMLHSLCFYRFLGYSYYALNDFKNALLCYDKINCLKMFDANDAVDWYNKSVILRRLKRDKEFEEAFAKAVELGIVQIYTSRGAGVAVKHTGRDGQHHH